MKSAPEPSNRPDDDTPSRCPNADALGPRRRRYAGVPTPCITTVRLPSGLTATSDGPLAALPSAPAIEGSPATIRDCLPPEILVIAPENPTHSLSPLSGSVIHLPCPPRPASAT